MGNVIEDIYRIIKQDAEEMEMNDDIKTNIESKKEDLKEYEKTKNPIL